MFSICIPIYNFNVTQLVLTLRRQLTESGQPFEIILMDDASDEAFRKINRELTSGQVRYIQLQKNIGRSRIRNKLTSETHYPYLIFMDCDSIIDSDNYISNYLTVCTPMVVCYGGRKYKDEKPENSFLLRWQYGIQRESFPASIRKKNPNYSFCTNNFLIDKNLFKQVQFNEKLEGYGHEDTYFGLELSAQSVTVEHIDNPLVHIGLESAEEFLKKSENAIDNLIKVDLLLQELHPEYLNHSRLIRMGTCIRTWKLERAMSFVFRIFKKPMKIQLLSNRPSLMVFDIYRLGMLCCLQSKKGNIKNRIQS
jgi:Predicted glycosyltransferases